jgi:cytochrome b561
MVPEMPFAPITDAQKAEKNFLAADLDQRLQSGPLRWHLIAERGTTLATRLTTPRCNGPTIVNVIDAGTLVIERTTSQEDGTVPRHQLRSDDPARGHQVLGRSTACRALGGLFAVVQAPHSRRSAAIPRSIIRPTRKTEIAHDADALTFQPLARLLHWTMAPLILAMLFIGVGMVATVSRAHTTLIAIHRPLGIAIAAAGGSACGLRAHHARQPAVAERYADTAALAAKLSHLVLYALMAAMPLIGWAMLSAAGYPVTLIWPAAFAADRAA